MSSTDTEPRIGPGYTPAAVRAALHQIPARLAAATSMADGTLPQGRFTTDKVTVRLDAPVSPSPAWDEIDQIRRWAIDWVDTVAAVLDAPGRRVSHWPNPTLGQALTFIDGVLEAALDSPIGPQLAREILDTELRLTLRAGLEEHRTRLPVPCVVCDRLSLVQADGSGTVECTAADCRHVWDRAQYDRLLTSTAVHHAATQRGRISA